MNFLRRWYRYFTNPTPMPYQVWELDGVGEVTIVDVDIILPGIGRVSYRPKGKYSSVYSWMTPFCSSAILKINRLTKDD